MIRILGLVAVVVVLLPISAGEDAMDTAHPGLLLELIGSAGSAGRCGGTIQPSRKAQVVSLSDSLPTLEGRYYGRCRCSSTASGPIQSDRTGQDRQPRPMPSPLLSASFLPRLQS